MRRDRGAGRQQVGRLAGWRILGTLAVTLALGATIIWGYLVSDDRRAMVVMVSMGAVGLIYGGRMLVYLAAIVLRGGCGLYVEDDRLVLLFPFYRAIPLKQITSVKLGDDYFVVGWPRWVMIQGWGDQRIVAHCVYFRTSYREMAARLAALGLPVEDDPRLRIDPFAAEPQPDRSIPRGNHAGVLDHKDGGAA